MNMELQWGEACLTFADVGLGQRLIRTVDDEIRKYKEQFGREGMPASELIEWLEQNHAEEAGPLIEWLKASNEFYREITKALFPGAEAEDYRVLDISMNSPLTLLVGGVLVGLILIAAITGGKVAFDMSPANGVHFEAKFDKPLGKGLKDLIDASQKMGIIFQGHDEGARPGGSGSGGNELQPGDTSMELDDFNPDSAPGN